MTHKEACDEIKAAIAWAARGSTRRTRLDGPRCTTNMSFLYRRTDMAHADSGCVDRFGYAEAHPPGSPRQDVPSSFTTARSKIFLFPVTGEKATTRASSNVAMPGFGARETAAVADLNTFATQK